MTDTPANRCDVCLLPLVAKGKWAPGKQCPKMFPEGSIAACYRLGYMRLRAADAESTQPAERDGEWVSVELATLLGVLAYLTAEIGQYQKESNAPSRIKRAKELLENALPVPPQPKGTK